MRRKLPHAIPSLLLGREVASLGAEGSFFFLKSAVVCWQLQPESGVPLVVAWAHCRTAGSSVLRAINLLPSSCMYRNLPVSSEST